MEPSLKFAAFMGVLAISAFGLLWYLEYTEYQNDKAYVEMCETMGGVAVLGKRNTNQCFDASVVLGAE